ncbi:MAG: sugar phosphate isomerase/epimerase family protein [Planctomycetaceae bacterium]
MTKTITSAAELVLSTTNWLDESSKIRTCCDLRLSINQLTTHHWKMRADLVQFPRLGVCGIGLCRTKMEELGFARSLEFLKKSGLKATSLSFAGGFAGANGMGFKSALKDAGRAVKLASMAGADVLVVTTGDRGTHTVKHAMRNARHAMRKLADYAAKYGVKIALMPMRPTGTRNLSMCSSLDDALEVLGRVNHPFLKLAFHTFHLGDTPDLLTRIPEIAPHVASVHISDLDCPKASAYDQKKPGDGKLNLPGIVKAFDDAGYRGAYELNIWSERLWKSDYSTLLGGCVRYLHEQVLQPTNSVS